MSPQLLLPIPIPRLRSLLLGALFVGLRLLMFGVQLSKE
jgi:hypothetical protein